MKALDEAFSPSMPSWMREVLRGKVHRIEELLMNQGIVPESATFHEYPVPTSPRDPIKNDPDKIVFYDLLLSNANDHNIFVWGISNNDVFYNPIDDKLYYMKEASWTKIFQACLHVCYIDRKDIDASYLASKKVSRQQDSWFNGVLDGTRSGDITDSEGSVSDRQFTPFKNNRIPTDVQSKIKSDSDKYRKSMNLPELEFDKSGYLKDPDLLKRLLRKYPNVKYKTAQSKLEKIYNTILEYRTDISNLILANPLTELSLDRENKLPDLKNTLSQLRYGYQKAYELLEQVLADEISDRYFTRNFDSRLNDLQQTIKRMDSLVSSNKMYEVDWDSDDMYIDDED